MATKGKVTKVMSSTKAATKKALLENLSPAIQTGMLTDCPEHFEAARERLATLVQSNGVVRLSVVKAGTRWPANVVWLAVSSIGRQRQEERIHLRPTIVDRVRRALDEQHVDLTAETILRWHFTIDGDGPWSLREIAETNEEAGFEGWLPTVADECRKVGNSVEVDFGAGGRMLFTRVSKPA